MNQTPVHPALARFDPTSNELLLGGIPLSRVAAAAGRSPFYAYDRQFMIDRVARIRQALPEAIQLHYAIKANPMPAVVSCLAREVDGLDVASGGELRVALDSGVVPRDISFAGPGKRREELLQAVAAGAVVIVESEREIELLAEIQRETGWEARAALRVNPAFEIRGSGMRMGGGPKPFGIDSERMPQALEQLGQSGLRFEGFHFFPGSQNLNAQAIVDAHIRSFELALELARHAPCPPRFLNLGGGFGIPYFAGDTELDLGPIAAQLKTIAERAHAELPEAELIIELGRYLVGEAGVYVTQVLDRKVSRGQVYLVVDGGLHHHLAASGNFGQVLRRNYPMSLGRRSTEDLEVVSVVGPLCTPLDLLGHQVTLPRAEPGDWIVIYQSGAYGASASPQDFLGHPPVLELLL